MWLAKKAAGRVPAQNGGCSIGMVTIGGAKPSVFTEGEIRNAEIASMGCMSLPKIGDEVLVFRSSEGDNIVAGRLGQEIPKGAAEGEVYITTANGKIQIKKTGEIIIEGVKLLLKGSTEIVGPLVINGMAYTSSSGKEG